MSGSRKDEKSKPDSKNSGLINERKIKYRPTFDNGPVLERVGKNLIHGEYGLAEEKQCLMSLADSKKILVLDSKEMNDYTSQVAKQSCNRVFFMKVDREKSTFSLFQKSVEESETSISLIDFPVSVADVFYQAKPRCGDFPSLSADGRALLYRNTAVGSPVLLFDLETQTGDGRARSFPLDAEYFGAVPLILKDWYLRRPGEDSIRIMRLDAQAQLASELGAIRVPKNFSFMQASHQGNNIFVSFNRGDHTSSAFCFSRKLHCEKLYEGSGGALAREGFIYVEEAGCKHFIGFFKTKNVKESITLSRGSGRVFSFNDGKAIAMENRNAGEISCFEIESMQEEPEAKKTYQVPTLFTDALREVGGIPKEVAALVYDYYRADEEAFITPRIIIGLRIYEMLNPEGKISDAKNNLPANQKNFLEGLQDIDIVDGDRMDRIEDLIAEHLKGVSPLPTNINDLVNEIKEICKKVDAIIQKEATVDAKSASTPAPK